MRTVKTEQVEMKRSWLVQRLGPARRAANPFSFGGGLRNGGLSEDAMNLLGGLFSFEYMGASEFEWGAVPEALRSIAQQKYPLTADSFEIPLAKVERGWREPKDAPGPDGSEMIYVLCPAANKAEVVERIKGFAAGRESLKERTRLAEVLRPSGDYVPDTCGWLDLDNGFFFFTDKAMWSATCSLFGVSR
jgi:hypothetical protein